MGDWTGNSCRHSNAAYIVHVDYIQYWYNLDVYANATNLHLMNANSVDSVNGYADIIFA